MSTMPSQLMSPRMHGVAAGVGVTVAVLVAVGVSVPVGVLVGVPRPVAVPVLVGVSVPVAVGVPVAVAVALTVAVFVLVAVGVGVSSAACQKPPVSSKLPLVSGCVASNWPIVPLREKLPLARAVSPPLATRARGRVKPLWAMTALVPTSKSKPSAMAARACRCGRRSQWRRMLGPHRLLQRGQAVF
jgi:hypothetical protein